MLSGWRSALIHRIVSVYDTSGRLLRQENIVDYTKSNILGEYASLEQFILRWTADEKKTEIRSLLREKGVDLDTLKHDLEMDDVDDYDFICRQSLPLMRFATVRKYSVLMSAIP